MEGSISCKLQRGQTGRSCQHRTLNRAAPAVFTHGHIHLGLSALCHPAHVHQNDPAAARRLSRRVVRGHGVFSGRAAPGLSLCAPLNPLPVAAHRHICACGASPRNLHRPADLHCLGPGKTAGRRPGILADRRIHVFRRLALLCRGRKWPAIAGMVRPHPA